MSRLRIEKVDGGDATVHDWQYVHNLVIPTHHRSLDEVRERSRHNVLEVAYLDGTVIGCTTVRPPTSGTSTSGTPTGEAPAATVIARVLPDHRGQGFGGELYERGLAQARELGAEVIETVVLASNTDGLRFARQRGFVEIDEYLLPGETIPWFDLRLQPEETTR
ncbi:GNAT family N-acetyltransferase [Streptomyces sp. NPDC002611]